MALKKQCLKNIKKHPYLKCYIISAEKLIFFKQTNFFPNRHCQLWSFWFVFCVFVFAFINCKICYRDQRFQAKYISALKPGILTHESLEIDLLLQLIPIEHPKICSFLTTLVSFFRSGGFHFSLIRSQSHWSRNQPAAPLKSVVTRVKSVFPDQFPTFSLSVSSCIQNGKPKILWSCDCFGCQPACCNGCPLFSWKAQICSQSVANYSPMGGDIVWSAKQTQNRERKNRTGLTAAVKTF